MKANEDQRLQHQLDHQKAVDSPADPNAQAYQKLYAALAAPPHPSLSEGFAERVVARAMQPKWYHQYGHLLSYAAWTILSLLLCTLAIYYTDAAFLRSFAVWLLRFKEIIFFGFATLLLVQLGDRWLVRSK